MEYSEQTRNLIAEVGDAPTHHGDEVIHQKFYYLRLDNHTSGSDIGLVERLARDNPSKSSTFDPSLVNSWTGGTIIQGKADNAPRRAASADELNPDKVVGTILVLTPTSESDTEASGTVTYTYNVMLNSPDAVDQESPFTFNWTATPGVVTSVLDLDIAPGGSQKVIYYNLEGRSSETPFDGVNIVVLRSTNGKTTTTKMVK